MKTFFVILLVALIFGSGFISGYVYYVVKLHSAFETAFDQGKKKGLFK